MTDEELNRRFDRISNHIEALTESLDRFDQHLQQTEELQAQDRLRRIEEQARADQRLARLERLFGLLLRAGQRERKELRVKINTLIDAQIRTDAAMARTDAAIAQLVRSQAESQARTGAALAQLAQAQAEMMRVVTKTNQRLDTIESNGGQ